MFKIGDYAVDEFGNVTTTNVKLIINSSSINFRHATEQEIEKYHFLMSEELMLNENK